MELTMEKEKTWCELVKLYQKNVNVATFTTLLYVTLNITNTSAMGYIVVTKTYSSLRTIDILRI